MEIHAFTTDNVDEKLTEITNLLYMLELSIFGAQTYGTFEKADREAFFDLINITKDKVTALIKSRQTVCLNWADDKNILLIEA
jgi:uncharacterized protein YfkK (UPF0435 family)